MKSHHKPSADERSAKTGRPVERGKASREFDRKRRTRRVSKKEEK